MRTGLVLGLDGAGKTLLLRQLTAHGVRQHTSILKKLSALLPRNLSMYEGLTDGVNAVDPSTQPSVGVEHWTLPLEGGKTCTLREVGGQLLPMWSSYFTSCHFWLYVVDVSNAPQLVAAAIEFLAILRVDEMRRKPKLLVLNQIDANFVIDDAILRTYLGLDRLVVESGPVHVLKTSALTGQNVMHILKWLSQTVNGLVTSSLVLRARYPKFGRQSDRVFPVE